MRVRLLLPGKTTPSYLAEGCEIYFKRLQHYLTLEIRYLPEIKRNPSMTLPALKQAESQVIRKAIKDQDYLVLLDEKGKSFTSKELASFLGKEINQGRRECTFVIGGAYGFDELLKKRADLILSLSDMTFPNQLTRLIFLEQLYRACTILKNENYHHE